MFVTISNPPGDGLAQMRAVLDSVEPGAGSHCLFHHTVYGCDLYPQTEIYRHVRLNITVHITHVLTALPEPWWVAAKRWHDLEPVT